MRPTTSASNLFRRQLCPGSARMEAGLPEEDSELSREGQLLHDYSAHPEYERTVLKPSQRDLLSLADQLTNKVIATVESEHGLTGIECNDWIEKTYSENGFSGTPDIVRHYRTDLNAQGAALLVIDIKFGYNIVERAELNLQLRCYAVLAVGDIASFLALGSTAYVAIVQPRVARDDQITIAAYTMQDIASAREQILEIIKAAQKPDAPLVPGEEQCRYCKAKLICPAFRQALHIPCDTLLVEVGEGEVNPYGMSKASREVYLEKRLSECSDLQLGNVLYAVKLAAMVKELANDEARKRITAGAMTDYELGKESEVREITDVRRAISLLSLAGMDKSDIFACVTKFSLTNLGEQLRKVHPTWDWKTVNDWVNKKLKSVIEIETRKPRILKK